MDRRPAQHPGCLRRRGTKDIPGIAASYGVQSEQVKTISELTSAIKDLLHSTAARWRDGKIIEEYLFYDNGAFLSQVGLA